VRALGVAIAVLGAGALLALGAAAALGRFAQNPNPSAGYPVDPRTVNGLDPFSLLPKPQECSLARDHPGVQDYFPLSRLHRTQGASPFATGAPATTILTLVNKKGQQFTIYVSGSTTEAVNTYVNQTSACVEAFPLIKPDPVVLVPVALSDRLVGAAVQQTGMSQAALSALRDSLTTATRSLSDVVTAAGGNVDAVVQSAAAAASSDLAARVAAGDLTSPEVAALDVPSAMKDLMFQANAPFLTSPALDASTDAARGKLLQANATGGVVVGIVPVSTSAHPLPSRYIAWAAFDPTSPKRATGSARRQESPLGAGQYDNYNAKCQASAMAQIQVWQGAATVKLWRLSDYHDFGPASAAYPKSKRLAASWPTTRTYDAWVRGDVGPAVYTMLYGWTIGPKNSCP
jgi:hypothetical protein